MNILEKMEDNVKKQAMRGFIAHMLKQGENKDAKSYMRVERDDEKFLIVNFALDNEMGGKLYFVAGSGAHKLAKEAME